MKLWVDAKREPEVDWVWAKTSHCAIAMLKGGCVERISFAPDQRKLISPVVDWMMGNDVHPRRQVHKRTDGVCYPRGMLRVAGAALL